MAIRMRAMRAMASLLVVAGCGSSQPEGTPLPGTTAANPAPSEPELSSHLDDDGWRRWELPLEWPTPPERHTVPMPSRDDDLSELVRLRSENLARGVADPRGASLHDVSIPRRVLGTRSRSFTVRALVVPETRGGVRFAILGGALWPIDGLGPALDLARNVMTPPAVAATALPSSPGLVSPTPIASASSSDGSRTWLFVGVGAVLTLFGGGACCLGGIFALGLLGSGGGNESGSLASGPITWNGELATDDRMEGSRYYDTFAFEALPGQRFTVELNSNAFDPVLRLGTPSGLSMEDDDGGGSLNSRIDIPSAEAGTYTVHVTTYALQSRGPYVVMVHQ